MSRDVRVWTKSKLAGAWSAEAIIGDLTSELILQIRDVFDDLDPLIRVRVLIACCLLEPGRQKELAPAVRLLLRTATKDRDEWVRFYGHALSVEEGGIVLHQALAVFPEVRNFALLLTVCHDMLDRRSVQSRRCARLQMVL